MNNSPSKFSILFFHGWGSLFFYFSRLLNQASKLMTWNQSLKQETIETNLV